MTDKKRLPPIHPGEILREEFLAPLGMTAHQLALALRVPATQHDTHRARRAARTLLPVATNIINEKRGITADTALRLSRYFGTTAKFWLNLQVSCELEVAADQLEKVVIREVLPRDSRLSDAGRCGGQE